MEEFLFKEKTYYRTNKFETSKTTLVFVHGVCGSSSAWWEYEKKFKEKYNILSFDIRGHGKSHRYEKYEDYEIANFTNDLYELIDYLNIKNFIMISHSYGTFISLDFVSKYKNLVKALVFLSPNFNVSIMPETKILKPVFNILSKIKYPISLKKERKHLDYLTNYSNAGDFNIKRTIADVSNTGLRVYLYCMNQSFSFNGENILSKINIPTLIIHGKKDTIFPIKYGILMASKIKDSEIVMLENVCHEIKDSPSTIHKISTAIENFIEKVVWL